MNKTQAYQQLQLMRQTHRVSPQTVIAWYYFFEDRLPRIHPERSRRDLLQALALWKALTARGGEPGFPASYAIDAELQPQSQADYEALSELAAVEKLQATQYRRKWATARKHLPLTDVAAAGGWKSTLLRCYQQPDEATMLQVVLGGGELRERKA